MALDIMSSKLQELLRGIMDVIGPVGPAVGTLVGVVMKLGCDWSDAEPSE